MQNNTKPYAEYEPIDHIYTTKERVQGLAVAAGHLAALVVARGTISIVKYLDNRQDVRYLGRELPGTPIEHFSGE